MNYTMNKRLKTTVVGLIVITLFVGMMYHFYKQARTASDRIMAEQIEQLVTIFKKIDADCRINAITHEHGYIDFLTVRSFAGSEVGCLNLSYPEQWKGPYIPVNYTMQGKLYEIIKTHEGYYIVPGKGVQLSNGKIIGKDIIFTPKTDIESYVNNTVGLEWNGKPLAIKLPVQLQEPVGSLLLQNALVQNPE